MDRHRGYRKRGRSRSRSNSPSSRNSRRRRSASENIAVSYKKFKDMRRNLKAFEVGREYCGMVNDLAKNGTFGMDGDFFREHRNEEWFQEKYKPSLVNERVKKLAEGTNERVEKFKSDFDHGNIDVNRDLEGSSEVANDEENDAPSVEFEDNAVFIVSVPAVVPRKLLEETLASSPGFLSVSLAEPNRFKGFSRVGWAYYDSQESCKAAIEKLNDFKLMDFYFLHLLPNKKAAKSRKLREAPAISLTADRIAKDVDQSVKLIRKLDDDRRVKSNCLLCEQGIMSLYTEPLQKLNLALSYLRNVHYFCYYCSKSFLDDDEVRSTCFKNHLRKSDSKKVDENTTENPATAEEDAPSTQPFVSEDRWVADLDSKTERFLNSREEIKFDEDLSKLGEPFLDFMCEELEPGKVRCGHCSKLFRGIEFVQKHFINKHKEVFDQELEKFENFEFFRAYCSDPDRPFAQPMNAPRGPGRQPYISGPQYPPYGFPPMHAPYPLSSGYPAQPLPPYAHYPPGPPSRMPFDRPAYQGEYNPAPRFGGPPIPPRPSREYQESGASIPEDRNIAAATLPPIPPVPEHAKKRQLVSYKDFDSILKEKEPEIDYGF